MLGWLDYSLSAADRDTSNQKEATVFPFSTGSKTSLELRFRKKTKTTTSTNHPINPRGNTTTFPQSNLRGNAQQQLRWAASSAAALLMSFVVTLQPAQVETVGCLVGSWVGWVGCLIARHLSQKWFVGCLFGMVLDS